MPSTQAVAAKYLLRLFKTLSLPDLPSLKYRRFIMSKVVPRLAPKLKGVGLEKVDASGVAAEWLTPDGAVEDRALLYLHGGAYVSGDIQSHRNLASRIAISCGCRALIIDYRLAPENAFPAALEDAVSAYRWLLEQGYKPEKIAIAGDSAGGGLAVATLIFLRDQNDPLPAAAMLLSPWVDLEQSGTSYRTMSRKDPMINVRGLRKDALMYAGGNSLRDPLISPIYADLKGLPPLYIQVGTLEALLDDSLKLARNGERDGVEVELDVANGMFHVYQIFSPIVPESNHAISKLGSFYEEKVGNAS